MVVTATTVKCPLCQNETGEVEKVGIRENPETPVYRCVHCLLRFIESPFDDLREYYRSKYRDTHSYVPGITQTPEEAFNTMRPLIRRREQVFRENVPAGAKVLEVGCGSGFFLDAIQNDYTVYGNEWNPVDAAYVRDVGEIPCSEEDLPDAFPGEKFTAICAFHVFEHIADPIKWLKQAKERLIGGGWLILEVPNVDDALLTLYDIPEYRDFYFRDAHVIYYSGQTLANAMGAVGFETRVSQTQRYSMWNHMNWVNGGKPMPDPRTAQLPFMPVPADHIAQGVVNRFWGRIDREYRVMLDTMKACDTLMAVGRKREI